MAYPFPVGYQPIQYPQQYQVPQMSPTPMSGTSQQQNNNMVWILGEAGAKSYILAPNTTMPLWDSESQTIYLKSTDASGMPSMKILDYTIRDTAQPQTPAVADPAHSAEYVTLEEFRKFEKTMKDQIQKLKKEAQDEHTTTSRTNSK